MAGGRQGRAGPHQRARARRARVVREGIPLARRPAADQERLKEVGVKLDQCWDLLHAAPGPPLGRHGSRRGQSVRDERTVEGYVN